MKQYKIDVIAEMEKLAEDLSEISLREAALNIGINHLKRQECCEILDVFCKKHPEYHAVRMMDTPCDSLFCSAVVTTHEYESEEGFLASLNNV